MFGALLILLLPLAFSRLSLRTNRYRPLLTVFFWIFCLNFLFLLWVGARPIAQPYILLGQLSTVIYFVYFITLLLVSGFLCLSVSSGAIQRKPLRVRVRVRVSFLICAQQSVQKQKRLRLLEENKSCIKSCVVDLCLRWMC